MACVTLNLPSLYQKSISCASATNATSSKLRKYTLENFNDVISAGFEYEIPRDVVAIIEELSKRVTNTPCTVSPLFTTRGNRKFSEKTASRKMKDDDWDNLHTAKAPSQLIVEKSDISIIKTYLNKITDKTYEDYCRNIIEIIRNNEENETKKSEICKLIFQVASNNRFYSKLYANLISVLIGEFPSMSELFDTIRKQFVALFDDETDATLKKSKESDYDLMCAVNKFNESRKSLSTFFVNLTKNGIMKRKEVYDIIVILIIKMNDILSNKDMVSKVEELIENVAILYDKEIFTQKEDDEHEDILAVIVTLSKQYKNPEYPALSNKAIFKLMDVIDNYK